MNDMIMDMLIFKYYYVFLIEETIRKSWLEFYQNLSNLRQFNMRSSLRDSTQLVKPSSLGCC